MDRRRMSMPPFGRQFHEQLSLSALLKTLIVGPGTALRGPMSRRSSGEIINATLVEVFLAFLFVVLSLAWFATRDLRLAQDKNRESEQRATNAERERDAATGAKR